VPSLADVALAFAAMIVVGRAETPDERTEVARFFYSVYVEEMGRFRNVADHGRRELREPEDAHSWLFVARDEGVVIGACRLTWGRNGFSERQIRQYSLEPFLAEMPAEGLVVGERTMVAPAYRGGTVWTDLGRSTAPVIEEHHVALVFGASEPHLVPMYATLGQRPYAPRNFFSEESGYMIPNLSIPADLAEARAARRAPEYGVPFDWHNGSVVQSLPAGVSRHLDTFGSVWAAALQGDDAYRTHVAETLADIAPAADGLFVGLAESGIARCTERSVIIDCRAGDRVIKRDGTARNPYLVLSGQMQARDGDRIIQTLSSGDVFGQAGLLLRSPRTADVFASADARILSLSEKSLRSVMNGGGDDGRVLLSNLVAMLASRLRDTNTLSG
jgi:Cyclic nucleotide-binding domain/Acetyltransferase (GNAT) domain